MRINHEYGMPQASIRDLQATIYAIMLATGLREIRITEEQIERACQSTATIHIDEDMSTGDRTIRIS